MSNRAFMFHALIYIVITVLLVAINMATSSHVIWSIWPALGWGLGVAFHGFSLVIFQAKN
ncbi:hypothetical protein R50073_34130 [Maricurvus nonylphenolicus]|uniref:2TM domain-containing protein n=1 Tax=Maricurvus nonylphenolicus TaxID=1008307 RepID=UPI0036F204BB